MRTLTLTLLRALTLAPTATLAGDREMGQFPHETEWRTATTCYGGRCVTTGGRVNRVPKT